MLGFTMGINCWEKSYNDFFCFFQEECAAVKCVHLDLTDWDATKAALEPLPRMDGLVNNAAVAICEPFLEVKPEDFDL